MHVIFGAFYFEFKTIHSVAVIHTHKHVAMNAYGVYWIPSLHVTAEHIVQSKCLLYPLDRENARSICGDSEESWHITCVCCWSENQIQIRKLIPRHFSIHHTYTHTHTRFSLNDTHSYVLCRLQTSTPNTHTGRQRFFLYGERNRYMWPTSFILHANDKEHSINSIIELCSIRIHAHRPICQSHYYTREPKFTCQFLNVSEKKN